MHFPSTSTKTLTVYLSFLHCMESLFIHGAHEQGNFLVRLFHVFEA